jgi:hypothetical protein
MSFVPPSPADLRVLGREFGCDLSDAEATALRGFMSPLSWIVVSLGSIGLALAWAVSVRRLVRARQGV